MKSKLYEIITDSFKRAYEKGFFPSARLVEIEIEEPRKAEHGDFSTNAAMKSASLYKMPPKKIAEILLDSIKDTEGIIEKAEIAGSGFINFFISKKFWYPILKQIHKKGALYGSADIGKGKKVLIEFVSANPTGPLHIGHGRGAAVGDVFAKIFSFCGYKVSKEYYLNDAGRQINTLGRSVFLRYKEIFDKKIDFPQDCYKGGYIKDIANKIKELKKDQLLKAEEKDTIKFCAKFAADVILKGIKQDLSEFGVEFDNWFSERSLYKFGKIDAAIEDFKEKKYIYEKEGALWFNSSLFGDEKDRVVVRQNKEATYFASDIAYHKDKFERGFDKVIDVWGADHHGYIPRLKAAIQTLGYKKENFEVILIQFVNLLRDGIPIAMSTRAGEFVTLKEVIKEVGKDAARFIFLTRHHESPLDFDLELAKKRSSDNPLYYVQYVCARISSIISKKQEDKKGSFGSEYDISALMLLKEPEEISIIKNLSLFQETVILAAAFAEPHRIVYYLIELASLFHNYYNKHKILTDDVLLEKARIYLAQAIKTVIKSGLNLLGVEALERM
ncbi:MAG: arginine--tRNA ligase [Deltaproteobacteria bacterium]|nr:arginine--tRNA ligase [Deltaproteobacteria bacterium]